MVVSQSTDGTTGHAAAIRRAATMVPSVIAASPKKSSIRRLSPLSLSRSSSVSGPSRGRFGSRALPPRSSAGIAMQAASQMLVTITSAASAPDMRFGSVSKAAASA